MDRSHGEVGEPVRNGILVGAAQPHVAVVVPAEELVGQAEVEVQEASGPRCDLGGQRHALEELTGAVPLPDPAVQAGRWTTASECTWFGRAPTSSPSAASRSAKAPSRSPRCTRDTACVTWTRAAQDDDVLRRVRLVVQPTLGPAQKGLRPRRGSRGVGEDRFLDEAGDVVVQVPADPYPSDLHGRRDDRANVTLGQEHEAHQPAGGRVDGEPPVSSTSAPIVRVAVRISTRTGES